MGADRKGLKCEPLDTDLYVCEVVGTEDRLLCELIETARGFKLDCAKATERSLVLASVVAAYGR